jgi:tripartite-type tricarboxylate transporter receptor subunit TctC
VPYKGIPEALTAVVSGSVQFNFSPVVNVLPLSRDGKLLGARRLHRKALGDLARCDAGIKPE